MKFSSSQRELAAQYVKLGRGRETLRLLRPCAAAVVAALTATTFSPVTVAADTGGVALEEIVVTARKREEKALDVPATIQVFDHEKLVELNADSLADLQKSVPNLFFTGDRLNTTSVTMRGLGAALGVPPGVGLYIDGAYQIDAGAFTLPLYDIERIEVLKGPQGTLYGRNSFAGAINYITRAPSERLSGEVQLEAGNGGTEKGSGSISGAVFGGVLRGRLTVGSQRSDGFRRYIGGAKADWQDYDAVNARVVFEPAESFNADLRFSYLDKSGGTFLFNAVNDVNDHHGTLQETSPFAIGPYRGQNQHQDLQQSSTVLKLTYSAPVFQLVSLSSYDDTKTKVLYDADLVQADVFNVYSTWERKGFSEEVRAQSTGEGPLSWLFGAYYTDGTNPAVNTNMLTLAGRFPNGLRRDNPKANFNGYAFFTDDEYKLSDHWVIGAGLRFDAIKKDTTTASGVLLSETFSGTQPKVTAKYLLSDIAQVYFTAARGFREGGFNTNAIGTAYQQYPNDTLWSYETGFKGRFAEGRGLFDVAAFYVDADSYNGNGNVTVNGVLSLITVPIGKVRSYGLELESSYQFTHRFSMDFSGGYNVAEPTKLATAAPGSVQVGKQVPYAPKWNARLSGNFDVPLTSALNLRFTAAGSGTGPTAFMVFPTAATPVAAPVTRDPFYVVDLSAALQWSHFTVTAFVRNATDTVYPEAYIDKTNGPATSGVVYNQPRYYGLSFGARF